MLAGYGTNFVALSIQGEPLSSHMLATFIQARQQAGLALGSYSKDVVIGIALVAALAPWLLKAPRPETSLGRWFLAVPALALGLTAMLIGQFTGRIEEFPSPVAVPVQAYFAHRESSVYLGPRDALDYPGPVEPRVDKVVFVVDEGVRADYIQLNNETLDNTPFLVSARASLANFGIATSYSNCSTTARMALRSGARDADFPDPRERLLHQPALWQFAKKAGYRTVYLDSWLPMHRMHSMLTYDEPGYIDEWAGMPLDPYWDVDNRVAERLIEELNEPGPAVLFVEKLGLHTPFERNVPPSAEYVPGPAAVPHRNLDAERAGHVRDYSVGVWWRVDQFFQRVLPAITRPGVLLIYTSDHGQALYEGGYDGSNCSGRNAVKGEGLVPLFVFATDEATRQVFQAAAARSFNKAAHSDIFPTLLWAMGFDPVRVEPGYSGGLLAVPENRQRRFFVFSPFAEAMEWVTVD
jgi:lipid A ethanolaminephosphotransferase